MLGFIFATLLTLANALSLTTIRQGNNDFDNCGFNLSATCDDKMTLFADGNLLATSDDWKTTSVVYIKPETQVVEIHCIDGWIHGGILASSDDNGLITDGTWSCTSDNGTTWNPAYVLGTNGVTAPDISPHAKWIWTGMNTWTHTQANRHTTAICKIQLDITQCPPTYPPWCPVTTSTVSSTTPTQTESTPSPGFGLSATCDEKMKVFADGNLLASSENWEVTSVVNIPAHTQLIEIHCMDNGILGGILASSDSGLKTDGTWSCSSDNGTTWSRAYEMGLNGAAVPDIDTDANWIWTGCIGDWTGKYTGNNKPKNVICKTILPKTSTSTTFRPQSVSPTPLVQDSCPGFIRSAKGKWCGDNKKDVLKAFIPPSSSISDAIKSRNDCEEFCCKETTCWGCSLHCGSPCQFNAIPKCGEVQTWSGGVIEGDISQKPGVLDGTCYSDEDHGSRLLAGYFSRSATNTPDECKDICYKEGYSYAGVQWTTECWCGNDEPPVSRITDSSQCNMNCPGDASQKCGGSSRMNIYKTGYLNTDNYKDCPEWKHLCTSGKFGDCMNTNCARTCKSLVSTTTTAFTTTTTFTSSLVTFPPTVALPFSNSSVCATLYENRGFEGSSFDLHTDQPLSNLDDFGWNDKISSIRVKTGSVLHVFEHANFEGEKLEITYNTVWTRGRKYNDWISSLRCYEPPSELINGTCYEDDGSRLLDDFHDSATNTPDECIGTCRSRGYSYAGVQYTSQCFCGNDQPPASRIRDSSQCNHRCPGDASLSCGGHWRMNIYTIVKTGLEAPNGYTVKNGDCPGNDIWELYREESSLAECSHLCNSSPQCQAFMLFNQRTCYPKTKSCVTPTQENPLNVFYSKTD